MWDVIRHPVDVIRDPLGESQSKADSDLTALASGESREMSCWLRGSSPELPQKFSQGVLLIRPDGTSWHHWFWHKNRIIQIPPLDRIQEIIRPGSRTTGKKLRGGMFTNGVASGPSGTMEFVLPRIGPELVRDVVERSAP